MKEYYKIKLEQLKDEYYRYQGFSEKIESEISKVQNDMVELFDDDLLKDVLQSDNQNDNKIRQLENMEYLNLIQKAYVESYNNYVENIESDKTIKITREEAARLGLKKERFFVFQYYADIFYKYPLILAFPVMILLTVIVVGGISFTFAMFVYTIVEGFKIFFTYLITL